MPKFNTFLSISEEVLFLYPKINIRKEYYYVGRNSENKQAGSDCCEQS